MTIINEKSVVCNKTFQLRTLGLYRVPNSLFTVIRKIQPTGQICYGTVLLIIINFILIYHA